MAQDSDKTDVIEGAVTRRNERAVRDAATAQPTPASRRSVPTADEDERVRIRGAAKPQREDKGSRRRDGDGGGNKALIGLGLGLATAGAAAFFYAIAKSEDALPDGPLLSDAPDHVLRGKALQRARNTQEGRALVGRTVTVAKPASELYTFWRAFERFPEFMDNVREIRRIDDQSSEWKIEAPAGATVSVKTRIVEDVPGKTIAWVSEPDSQIATEGRVEFADAPPGRGTYVRLLIRYTPPAGTLGRVIAKVFQREPNVQARRDLRRFKQLIETGEVTVNASPSGRKSESPTEARV